MRTQRRNPFSIQVSSLLARIESEAKVLSLRRNPFSIQVSSLCMNMIAIRTVAIEVVIPSQFRSVLSLKDHAIELTRPGS